jgi:hypothetical protein
MTERASGWQALPHAGLDEKLISPLLMHRLADLKSLQQSGFDTEAAGNSAGASERLAGPPPGHTSQRRTSGRFLAQQMASDDDG